MAGNTNYKQIAVYKNRKALIEFTDDTRYEKKAMAWPFERTSRIRVNAKDYSEGTGNWAIDAHHNLSHDEFFRLSDALTGAKEKVTEDCTRCKKYLELLRGLQQATPSVNENEILVKKIAEAEEELKKLQAGYVLFNERKILNYEKYINPENEEERQVTMLKVSYLPKYNFPYSFTVATGWGIPVVTKQNGVVIKEGSTHYDSQVNILLDEKALFPMLRRTEMFLQAMTTHALSEYYEAVTNPVLFCQLEGNL